LHPLLHPPEDVLLDLWIPFAQIHITVDTETHTYHPSRLDYNRQILSAFVFIRIKYDRRAIDFDDSLANFAARDIFHQQTA